MTVIATVGFAGKTLQQFVEALRAASVTRLIDVRLRPDSQLSGFARGKDLAYLLPAYEHIEYVHRPELAPTPAILDRYRKDGDWAAYAAAFHELMEERSMVSALHAAIAGHQTVALLCSEATPEQCHRRLLADAYAAAHGGGTRPQHL